MVLLGNDWQFLGNDSLMAAEIFVGVPYQGFVLVAICPGVVFMYFFPRRKQKRDVSMFLKIPLHVALSCKLENPSRRENPSRHENSSRRGF